MNKNHIGFIGLGLIGGSIAKALKENNPDIKITAFDINEASLDLAKEEVKKYLEVLNTWENMEFTYPE